MWATRDSAATGKTGTRSDEKGLWNFKRMRRAALQFGNPIGDMREAGQLQRKRKRHRPNPSYFARFQGHTTCRACSFVQLLCCRDSAVAPRRRRPMGVEYSVLGMAENCMYMGGTLAALLLVLFIIHLVRGP